MKLLTALGAEIIAIGVILAIFGAITTMTYAVGYESGCGTTCSISSFNEITHSYYLYPVWSVPTAVRSNFTGSCTIQRAWYTPLSAPPPCSLPPLSTSTNYDLNFVGVVLAALGIAAVTWNTTRRPTSDGATEHRPV